MPAKKKGCEDRGHGTLLQGGRGGLSEDHPGQFDDIAALTGVCSRTFCVIEHIFRNAICVQFMTMVSWS
jgi:hypothetical protein